MKTIEELNEARRQACLQKLIRYNGEVLTLAAYLEKYPTVSKKAYVQTHETRKINLCYRELDKPKTRYMVWHIENGRETGIEVPKLVFDALDVPEG